jgi:hypothetical protein
MAPHWLQNKGGHGEGVQASWGYKLSDTGGPSAARVGLVSSVEGTKTAGGKLLGPAGLHGRISVNPHLCGRRRVVSTPIYSRGIAGLVDIFTVV